jgi:hypothetical protein
LDFGEALGQYEDSPKYDGIVIGSGVYSLRSDTKNINKFRSFDSQDLIKLAIENGERPMVEIIKKGPVKLSEARRERYRWFNTFQEKRKRLDINFDHRRMWEPERLKDFNDLMGNIYGSRCLDFHDLRQVGRVPLEQQALMQADDTFDSLAYNDSSLLVGENSENLRRLLNPTMKDLIGII